MKNLTIKAKVLALAIIPVIFITITIMIIARVQLHTLEDQEVERVRAEMLLEKQSQLQDYMEMALSSVRAIINDPALTKTQAQAQAKKILHELKYDDTGYIFVFDYAGVALVHRAKPSTVGRNRYNDQDQTGRYLIRDIIQAGKRGGDFVEYHWTNKDDGRQLPKLSYAVPIPEWGWVLGTGFMIDDIEEKVIQIQANLDQKVTHMTLMMLLASGCVMGLILVVAFWVSSRVTTPLRHAAAAMVDIADGDGDLTRRLDAESKDELGELATGFNNFAIKTQDMVRDVQISVASLSDATTDMQRVVVRTHDDSQQQHHETQQVAAAIHEMAAAVQEVAGSAALAAQAALSANVESGTGATLVQDAIASINQLSDEVNRAGQAIQDLDEYADKISGVVHVIQSIAEQTNLLALNAAIEAARAGDKGRGFAVVADEVRTLATRTQNSTDEIQQVINNLLGGVQNAVKVIDHSKAKAADTIEQAGQAGHALQSITTSVSTITEMNTQIASAAEEQTAVAEEISKSVQQIADIAENSAQSADKLNNTASEMVGVENRLANLVNQFRV